MSSGMTLYSDKGLTIPFTGYSYVQDAAFVTRDLNSSTGVVGNMSPYQC